MSTPKNYYAGEITGVDFRAHPEKYRVGRGEQGVLMVEPYKGEILPHWKFRTPDVARKSAGEIYRLYEGYKAAGDFVGMDMARKFLQMGYTRSRRYANHPGGRKYKPGTREILPFSEDKVKAESAAIFRVKWKEVEADADYIHRLKAHKEEYG